MKKATFAGCLFALPVLGWSVAAHASAEAPSSCPAINSIVDVGGVGVYTVPNTPWIGIPASHDHHGAVVRFSEAAIYPEEGQLGRCTYELTKGQVDLRYVPEGPLGGVTATGNSWKHIPGPFGVVMQVCKGPDTEPCTFHVDERRHR